jgi:hypothetical protein
VRTQRASTLLGRWRRKPRIEMGEVRQLASERVTPFCGGERLAKPRPPFSDEEARQASLVLLSLIHRSSLPVLAIQLG